MTSLPVVAFEGKAPPVIQYALVDGWDTAALMQAAKGVDAIYIDVGGISGTDGLFEALALLRLLEAAFRPVPPPPPPPPSALFFVCCVNSRALLGCTDNHRHPSVSPPGRLQATSATLC